MQFGLCKICSKFLVFEIRIGAVVIHLGMAAGRHNVVNMLKLLNTYVIQTLAQLELKMFN